MNVRLCAASVRPTEIRAADQIVQCLRQHGVERVFGIPGGTISPVFDALIAAGIEIVSCQHETMAVYAAAGHARATGCPAVVAVTSGPGVLNALTGLAAADRDELPVLLLCGEADTRSFGRAPLQEGGTTGLDIVTIARSLTRHAELVMQPQRAAAAVDRALTTIGQAPYGAALLSLPFNVTRAPVSAASFVGQRTPPPRSPDLGLCAEIATLLGEAERPAIMLGVGAKRSGVGPIVRRIAERLGVPVLTDIEAKGCMPESHPLSLGVFGIGSRGHATAYLRRGVDLLVTVGCRLDDNTTNRYADVLRPAEGLLVQLDHDADRLGRAYAADRMLCADLVLTCEAIERALPAPSPADHDRRRRLARAPDPCSRLEAPSRAPHDPRRVAPALVAALGPDGALCCDIGNHLLFAAQSLAVDDPEGFWVSAGLGGMGSGLGVAIGMQVAYGDRRKVACIVGDGGLLMCGNELSTLARYQVPLVIVVYDDRRWGMVSDGFEQIYGHRPPQFDTPRADLVEYGRSMGVRSHRVDALTEIEPLLRAHPAEPLLLVVPIDPRVQPTNERNDVLGPDSKDRAPLG
ncbi:MAG: thiamine pyrophosphate-binding protein [Myxococcota bacterium]